MSDVFEYRDKLIYYLLPNLSPFLSEANIHGLILI